MAVFNSQQHTHLALAIPKKNGSVLPIIKFVKVHKADTFPTAIADLLCLGETITVDDKTFYLISHLSVKGRKYGAAAIIRKLLRETEMSLFTSNLETMAKELKHIHKTHTVGA